MKNNIFNYVLKRVLVFLVISVIIMLFNACEVHAESYQVETKPVTFYLATTQTSGTLSGNTDTLITASNYQAYYRFLLPFNTTTDTTANVLFIGQYLVELYVYSNKGIRNSLECYQLSSDFQNVNMTSGNWVNNEINSQCLDIYKTTYNGIPAYRILYKFTYKGGAYNTDAISEIRISLNSSPNDFFADSTNLDVIGVSMSNIYDYNPDMISQFALEKSNQISIEQSQTIINQNQEIINGQTDIINNQNQNTQDIIDNQNSNTDKEIESQKFCQKIDKINIVKENYLLNSSGVESSNSSYGITDYINVENSTIKTTKEFTYSTTSSNLCFYTINKELVSCINNATLTINSNLTIPNNATYVRFSIHKSQNMPQFEICTNGNQALVDSITDDNVSGAESQVNDLLNNNAFQDNSGIQSIITAPLSFIQGLTNTCSPIELTIPFIDTNVSIPCIKQELITRVPTIVPVLSTIINGFVIYRILLDIVAIVKSAREPDEDRIEVLDL